MKRMTLSDLQKQVADAIENAQERGEDPKEIVVTLQLERDGEDPIWGHESCELHYDGGGFATGCVLTAWVDADPIPGVNDQVEARR